VVPALDVSDQYAICGTGHLLQLNSMIVSDSVLCVNVACTAAASFVILLFPHGNTAIAPDGGPTSWRGNEMMRVNLVG
jgi:hypothetical protein